MIFDFFFFNLSIYPCVLYSSIYLYNHISIYLSKLSHLYLFYISFYFLFRSYGRFTLVFIISMRSETYWNNFYFKTGRRVWGWGSSPWNLAWPILFIKRFLFPSTLNCVLNRWHGLLELINRFITDRLLIPKVLVIISSPLIG